MLERFIPDGVAHTPQLPANEARQGVATAFALAVKEYTKRGGAADAIVVMVVQPDEHNAFDQRILEFELWETHGIALRRHTLAELHTDATYNDKDGTMMVQGLEVALVYYRAGYVSHLF
jgi:glutathione synthase